MVASERGHTEVVQELIKAGARLEAELTVKSYIFGEVLLECVRMYAFLI